MTPSRGPFVAAALLLAAAFVFGAGSAQSVVRQDPPPAGGPVNSECPYTGRPVTADSPTARYGGHTIGFCCRRCAGRWAAASEQAKSAVLARLVGTPAPEPPSPADGPAIARAYLRGMEAGDLDGMNRLFLPGGRSSILENASDEGSWERYRDHHLKPELEGTNDFSFSVTGEKEERFGSTVLVRQVGEFSIRVADEVRRYRAAVTYVMVEDAGRLKIAHLHWSSRPNANPARK